MNVCTAPHVPEYFILMTHNKKLKHFLTNINCLGNGFYGDKLDKPLEIVLGIFCVRALPLAAVINVGGHFKWHFFLFFSLSLFLSSGSLLILPEGVVVGFQIFAWAPGKLSIKKNILFMEFFIREEGGVYPFSITFCC